MSTQLRCDQWRPPSAAAAAALLTSVLLARRRSHADVSPLSAPRPCSPTAVVVADHMSGAGMFELVSRQAQTESERAADRVIALSRRGPQPSPPAAAPRHRTAPVHAVGRGEWNGELLSNVHALMPSARCRCCCCNHAGHRRRCCLCSARLCCCRCVWVTSSWSERSLS